MFSEGQEAETRDRNTNAISGSECATIVDCLIFAPFEDAFFPMAMMSKMAFCCCKYLSTRDFPGVTILRCDPHKVHVKSKKKTETLFPCMIINGSPFTGTPQTDDPGDDRCALSGPTTWIYTALLSCCPGIVR